ncbi:hypothetical protein ACFQX4_01315 [Roseomonas sp. GCM10028921]
MRGAAILAICGSLLLGSHAMAERTTIRVGDHPGLGRIVLDLTAPGAPYSVEEVQDGLILRLAQGLEPDLSLARRLPRNLVAMEPAPDGLRLTLRTGARLRHYRLGTYLVLDLHDGPAPRATPAAEPRVQPASRAAAGRQARGQGTVPPVPAPATSAPPALPVAAPVADSPPAPVREAAPAPAVPAPVAAGLPLHSIAGQEGRVLVLPLPAETGLAILRRGDTLLVVLDQPHAFDTSALRDDPVFGRLGAETFPEATVLRLPVTQPAMLRARRDGERWLLSALPELSRERSILAEPGEGRVVLRAAAPGRPVPISDPETGFPILVGTVREAGQGVPTARSLAQVDFLPTQLGVAALARADTVALRRVGDRFVLSGIAGVAASDPNAEAGSMTRIMEVPSIEAAAIQERLRSLQANIAAAPPLARLPLRREAAEALLALGLPQEAQAMLRLAFQEDPRASTDPRSLVAHGAAALLANRTFDAQGLTAANLPGSDEVTLWRAALAAANGDAAAASPGFAATIPLLVSYPELLKARLLPVAAEALVEGGDLAAASRLLRGVGARPDLAYARGRLAEAEGRAAEALSLYAGVAAGRDRLARAKALRRSVELRLATGALDAAAGAAALEAGLFAWRGDSEELGTRLRIAALRQAAGDPRGALEMLKETGGIFPDHAAQIRPTQEAALFQALAQEPPTLAVAMSEAYAALLPRDGRGAEALALLAERLAAMDLPERGAALAQQALDRAAPGQRAGLTTRLATLRLAAGDAPGALAALQAAPSDPAEMIARGRLTAQAKAALGARDEAAAVLRGLGPAGLPALAVLLAEQQDWAGASDALLSLATARPDDPATPREVLRAAAFAALGGDNARLGAIRAAWLGRLAPGPLADALAALTADPVRGLSDLPRLQRELDLFRGFPKRLEAFRTAARNPG